MQPNICKISSKEFMNWISTYENAIATELVTQTTINYSFRWWMETGGVSCKAMIWNGEMDHMWLGFSTGY